MTGPQYVVSVVTAAIVTVIMTVWLFGWEAYHEISTYVLVPLVLLAFAIEWGWRTWHER